MKAKYTPNQIINKLIFLKEIEPHIIPCGQKQRVAIFRCYCGKEFEATISNVKSTNTKSCGCRNLQKLIERNTKHGLSHLPLYTVWNSMIQRCYNPKHLSYQYYGARGITVCNEWLDNPVSFIKWALENGYKKGLTIDKDKHSPNKTGVIYSPEYCCFLTNTENNHYKSTVKLTMGIAQQIRRVKLLIPGITHKRLGNMYGVKKSIIGHILLNKAWKTSEAN